MAVVWYDRAVNCFLSLTIYPSMEYVSDKMRVWETWHRENEDEG